ncbi:gliding motility-associated C-terminal domain-containing protein [Chitinophaga sp. sic0106]|uniref:T9SS type B sorting domain-containing protein n=1 Tax=Chitinophaga sp. sic0106 TaxID=2854785 RepID=UPI001C468AED|nr:gliding motility-associated C-terminal domain-containing protein [Chitinophaga sp. sic0106]MBV7530653.1 gliding motility-associated C-terminal domain-containing protein [Chitinophaga sp. sic0106]
MRKTLLFLFTVLLFCLSAHAQLSVVITHTNISCAGRTDGSASATATGGIPPYSYSWSNGATTRTLSGLAPGLYTCTVTALGGATANASVVITQPAALTFTSSVTDVVCYGDATGSASVSVSGGTGPYTYNWLPSGGSAATASNLIAGDYRCVIIDANGCDVVANVTVADGTPISYTATQSNVLCRGESNGTATVTVAGAGGPFTYNWQPSGGSGATASNLAAGTYTCTITNNAGCDTTVTFDITEPAAVLSATATHTDARCFGGSTGSATVTVTGGTAPYSYSWSPTGGTSATANNLAAGSYTCTVTDANGCTTTATTTVSQPAAALGVTTAQTDILCFGAATGTATVTVTGGTSPYTYSWSGGGGTAATASNLLAGTYTCNITDANGCKITATVTITQPPQLALTGTKTNVLCNGNSTGSGTVIASGGVAPYTYSWSPSGGTGASASNLPAGTYTVTVTDANGCTKSITATITEPPALSATATAVNILCYGSATGSATVNVTGGVTPYSYSWSSGGGSAATANNLKAGTYTCTITDANGCVTTATTTVNQQPQITFTTSQTNVACNGGNAGSASVSVSGGTPGYTYSWSPSGGSAATANGLSAGTYTCLITDTYGCDTTATIIITEPPALTATATKTNISCNGANDGTINAIVGGGVQPYTYSWVPGGETTATVNGVGPGTYTCIATDANGCTITGTVSLTEPPPLTCSSSSTKVSCNGASDGTATAAATGGTAPYTYSWSTGATGVSLSNLAAGSYTCTITDANGCTCQTTVTVSQPAVLSGSTSDKDVTCNGAADGSVSVFPSGGTSPYTYAWSNGATTQHVDNLPPGDYTVVITDANGCVFNVTTPATITEPPVLSGSSTHTDVGCNGQSTGTATATASGGTAPYSYQWTPSGGAGATATGLAAGTYTCNITDANGCTTTTSVTINQSTTLAPNFTATDVSCKGAADGSATAAVTGGTAPYTYSWAPGGQTTPTISNQGPGTYTCTVTDANGCSVRQTVEIKEPALLVARDTLVSNVTCNGASDGIAKVTPSGGTAPYTYSWSPGGSTAATATGLAPGNYTTTVTDANGCTATSTVTVTEPAALDATITYHNTTGAGNSDGAATAHPTGGTAPYTYSWSPSGGTGATASGLAPGTYTCTVTDANGCTTTETVTITDSGTGLGAYTNQSDVSCNGANDGTASVTAYGGTPPYTYLWSPGDSTTATITGLAPGTYTCTITDNAGATQVVSVTIVQPPALSATASLGFNVTCFGGNNGSAIATASGGTPPYTYSWNNGGTNDTITNLIAGSYTVTVTDAKGCTATSSIAVEEPTQLVAAGSGTNVTCNGYNDGIATVNVSGGLPPYSYSWSGGGGSGQTATGLAPGDYTCTVTDLYGCSDTALVTITQPTSLTAGGETRNVSCNGAADGMARALVTGGTTPYTYSWVPGGQTLDSINNLAPGTYTAFVTDANGCQVIGTADIMQPAVLTASTTQTNTTCNGDTDGSATAAGNGGTAPYTYSWSNGAITATISNLAPGNYTCTVTDANGCTATTSVTITEPAVVSANINKVNVSCNAGTNGSITLSGTGGTSPYTYAWSNGATTATITGLAAGTYTCTITDLRGCTGTVTVDVTQPDAITGVVTQTNVSCNGLSDGIANLAVSGGTGPYTYLWAPQGGTGPIATGLPAGAYTCTVTDTRGCTGVINVTITQPDALVVNKHQENVTCNGAADGKVVLTPVGGTAPYTYTWSTGGTDSIATGLAPGTHQYEVKDANNCSVNQSFEIAEPPILVAGNTHTDVQCNGGSDGTATATVTGGRTPYTYLWTPGNQTTATATGLAAGTYLCTITDSSGCTTTTTAIIGQPTVLTATVSFTDVTCNGAGDGTAGVTASGGTSGYTYLWSNAATTASVTGLVPGTYTCTITDAHGCDTTISVDIQQPDLISFTTSQVNVLCNGAATGSATVTVDGGTVPYTYSWSPSGGSGNTASNLLAGTYTCTITDAHGCDTTVDVTITEPTAVTFTTSQTNVDCNGNNTGSATVVATGGVGSYTYSWSPSGGTAATASNLIAGVYTCDITDANNCTVTATVTITEPNELRATTSQVNVNCNGESTGSATVTVTGGTTPYAYLWSNGATTATINNLAAGTYTCNITDGQGCTTSATVIITQKAAFTVRITPGNVLCNGGNTGSISLAVSGGTSPYTYLWSNGATSATANNLAAGTYTATITDANGCDTTVSSTITEPTAFAVTASQVNVNCNGESTGSATVTVSGATSPYQYYWSSGATTATANNLAAGTYTCTITDANGCDTTATFTITENDALAANVTLQNVLCNGGNTGSISVAVTGGTAPYGYLWSNGATTASVSNLTAGLYTVTITDANGCDTAITTPVTEPPLITFTTAQVNVECNGDSTGSASVTVSGGVSPYTYSWSNGATTAAVNNLTAGTYTCTIMDDNGCDTSTTFTITEKDAVTGTTTQDSVLCKGGNNGSVTLTAAGGTAPYTYSWNNGATTAVINNLTAGIYICTITDANGCTGRVIATVAEPELLTFTTSQTDVNCNGAQTGSATINPDGGTRPYSFLWSNGATTRIVTGLGAGTYTCTITDANGCDTTATITITQKDAFTVGVTTVEVSCNGDSSGSISLAGSGGTAPYTYSWSNGGTTAAIGSLTAGTYTTTLTDANGCDTTFSVTITQPDALVFTTSQTNVNCNGDSTGTATVNPDGGLRPYRYSWSTGETTASISNLKAGTYTCTITDRNGCDTTASIIITETAAITAAITQNNVLCNGGNTGSLSLAVTGGTAPYTYLWNTGANTAGISNLTAGTYTCTITDANGCTGNSSATVTEPDLLIFATSQVNVNCNGANTGSATVNPDGGSRPYTYQWNTGATTATISNLTAGTYTCIITDRNGCDTTATVTITEKDAIATVVSQDNVLCNGNNTGRISLVVSGGTAPYTYAWSNGATAATVSNLAAGTYTVTITDVNGCDTTLSTTITQPDLLGFTTAQTDVNCNGGSTGTASVTATGGTLPYAYLWNTGATTATISNLAAGTYTCTITDANGCDTTATVAITENAAITGTLTQQNVLCNGGNTGSLSVTVTGGTAPYNYLWSNGATTATITGLTAGSYTCTITDVNGCTGSVTGTITMPPALAVATTASNVNCNGGNNGTASATATGGTAPYTYLWSNGATSSTINNLIAGDYIITITDANSCTISDTVTLTQSSAIIADITHTDTNCNGGNTGTATVSVTGGVPPYQYLWSNGATTASVMNLAAGTYTCKITDANGCEQTVSTTILTNGYEAVKLVADASGNNIADENEVLTYTIRVRNTGAITINTITITDAIPQRTTFISSATGTVNNNVITFSDTNLPAGQQRDYVFTVRTDEGIRGSIPQIVNTADVKVVTAGNVQCSTQVTVVIPVEQRLPLDLSVQKQTENKPVTVPDKFDYTIIVSNKGATAFPVTVTDTLPAGLTYISSIPSRGVASYNTANRVLTWTLDSLVDNASELLTIRVQADAMGTIVNTVSVTSPQVDEDLTNNTATVKKEVIPFHIPNVITPNGSGQNDRFVIKGLELYSENEILFFNRWNANVYHRKNYQNDWDGSGLNEGTYFYILKLKDSNGVWHTYRGNVLILRK